MQAIVTKYLGPTNHKGARIVAKCQAGTMTVPYEYALNQDGAHAEAVRELAKKLDWGGKVVQGELPDGTGYAFVWVERAHNLQPIEIVGTL